MTSKTAAPESRAGETFSQGLPVTAEFEKAWRDSAERREMGRTLERMRRGANLTQARLAELMGKDQAFVARMESGRGPMPKADSIALYATKCGFATAYAFVERVSGKKLALRELQPIAQDEEIAADLESVHDVALPVAEPA